MQPLLQRKSKTYYIFWVCVCSLRYPACNAHAPYCQYVWLYHIFPHYLINGTIFGKILLNTKCAFWCSLQLLSETFLILGRTERDIVINVHRSLCKAPVIHVRFQWKLNFLHSFFSKNTQISNFMKIRADRWTDGMTDMTKLIVAFRNFANVPKVQLLAHTKHILPTCFGCRPPLSGRSYTICRTDPNFPNLIKF